MTTPYPMSNFDPVSLLLAARREAEKKNAEVLSEARLDDGRRNKLLARNWIEGLTLACRAAYAPAEVRSTAKGFRPEIMLDIVVGETETVFSPYRRKQLLYFSKLFLGIESELSRKNSQILYDCQKLIIANARHRLLITSNPSDAGHLLAFLSPCARQCGTGLTVAMISHPVEWSGGIDIKGCWSWHSQEWQRLPSP